jgi:DNA-binding IclR family transcriptional regulator
MPAYTPRTITDPIALMEHLKTVRAQGYALALEEINPSVVGLAVAVPPSGRAVQAALIIAIPAFEATPERLETLRLACTDGARTLGDRLLPSSR